MKVITHHDIVNAKVAPKTCYDWVAYMIKHKADAILPAKISMKPMDGVFCNVMPSIINMPDGGRYGGVKVVTRYPERNPSLDSKLILFDACNGEFKAIMDANWITAMRTGAVATHSLLLFAKKNFNTIGIIGLGNAARATVSVLAEKVIDRNLKIKLLKYKNQEEQFKERFASVPNFEFEFCDSPEETVGGSDAVFSAATYLPNDICGDDCFAEGVTLIPIHTLGFTNCDLFFDKVYADDYNHVMHFKNFDKFKKFAEVSDVVNNRAQGRESDRERILIYNIGVSMHDLYFAANIYRLTENSEHKEIDFFEPHNKFWI